MCLPLRWSPSLTCSSLPANRLTPSPARMVVFHSPVQRQRRAPFSASPAPPGPLDEDPDNIFNATPGPARARSVLEGTSASKGAGGSSSHVKPSGKSIDNLMPASANLQQRLQQSLMLVADSPSSKLNAPDPFRPRNQLRRSPPVAMKAFDHHNVDGNKQSDDATRTPEQHTVLLMDEPVPQLSVRDLSVPSPAKKQRPRSFELAAKALFDNRKPDKGGQPFMTTLFLAETCIFRHHDHPGSYFSTCFRPTRSFSDASSFHFESSSETFIAN